MYAILIVRKKACADFRLEYYTGTYWQSFCTNSIRTLQYGLITQTTNFRRITFILKRWMAKHRASHFNARSIEKFISIGKTIIMYLKHAQRPTPQTANADRDFHDEQSRPSTNDWNEYNTEQNSTVGWWLLIWTEQIHDRARDLTQQTRLPLHVSFLCAWTGNLVDRRIKNNNEKKKKNTVRWNENTMRFFNTTGLRVCYAYEQETISSAILQ